MATVIDNSGAAQNARLDEPSTSPESRRRLDDPDLVRSLQRAYSGEKAAALAYIGHRGSLRDAAAKAVIKQIEEDEWAHRRHVRAIMEAHDIPISSWLEIRYYLIGKVIAWSCYIIGWFMPYFFAGKLESGNVCEYFVMMRRFRRLGIREHDTVLYEMGMKEKEHEVYFLDQVKTSRLLPWFEKVFSWGREHSRNDVDLSAKYPIDAGGLYCPEYPYPAEPRVNHGSTYSPP